MARVRTPAGVIVETSSPGALNYYRREPGYEVLSDEEKPRRAKASVKSDDSDAGKGVKQQ